MASKERRRERRADRQATEEDRRRSVTDSRCPRLEQHKHRKWLFCPPVLEEGELSWALLVWNRPCAAARGSWGQRHLGGIHHSSCSGDGGDGAVPGWSGMSAAAAPHS